MATPDVFLQGEHDIFSSFDYAKGDAKSRGFAIEKKIEYLESLNEKVSNRRARRWINDRILLELVPRLSGDEIRGLFAPPPWGDEVPPSPFSMTNVGEWDKFRNIDMDKEAGAIEALKDAFRRSFLPELVHGYEESIRAFVSEAASKEPLVLYVQDPFHRLLLHGVCEFYNLVSITESETKGTKVRVSKYGYSAKLPKTRTGTVVHRIKKPEPPEEEEEALCAKMAKKLVKYSVVDAFTETAFRGNPAAVCWLEDVQRDDEWLQLVATEFNLSQTCFVIPIVDEGSENPRFRLRWFTPVTEVKLCGHATLAASHCLFQSGLMKSNTIEFSTLSGTLTAQRVPDCKIKTNSSDSENGEAQSSFYIELNFPVVPVSDFNGLKFSEVSELLNGVSIVDVKKTESDDIFVVLPSAKEVVEFEPQIDKYRTSPGRGVLITGLAPEGSEFDFYSRFFCPKYGIDEDPVCGSAHCALAAYWHEKLGKCDFVAYQASPRSGILHLHLDKTNQRVLLRGKATTIMEGSLLI
ncbi:hypothetical protein OSB04_022918 [Centaurea solstitialis]|uniref:R3H domain-containing protein n=1 Tax=Centaurea solstitialis TaxID=347529 RepID=A0AA38SWG8_9ASTR|nr:hypothetical protein OSB04_022918 [Centaurea solstitialis]